MLKKYLILATLVCLTASIGAKEHVVDQKDKQFSISTIKIKIGDSISFRNSDPFFHNVYSLSPIKIFDLGSYKQGESKNVVYDKAGEADVHCAIHPNMKLKVTVEK
jgi:plastocyanin